MSRRSHVYEPKPFLFVQGSLSPTQDPSTYLRTRPFLCGGRGKGTTFGETTRARYGIMFFFSSNFASLDVTLFLFV